ncbi:MAG: biotin--[Oscillospiraceae bacterium]|nr:biotin--[acetyl-CoA-carboxylase] ligase [Oscillospiraceae bacterium]
MSEILSSAAIAAHLGSTADAWQTEVLLETDSTNTRLKERAKAGAPQRLLLVADKQTCGRGRLGRSFLSPAGSGIYMSLLVRPNIPMERCTDLTVAAAVCVARAVEQTCGLKAEIKWVNDLYAGGKKFCGILTEGSAKPDGYADYVVVGIGLNVGKLDCGSDHELAAIVTSLEEQGCTVSRTRLIAAILAEFERYYCHMQANQPDVLDEYRRRMFLIGKNVSLSTDPQKLPYTVLGVDDHAGLVVQGPDGKQLTLQSGEVSIRPNN